MPWLLAEAAGAAPSTGAREIIDTHQHLWDLGQLKLPWLSGAPEILRRNYLPSDYAEATGGFPIRAVYMEVAVAEADLNAEAAIVREACAKPGSQTFAAILGGRPEAAGFLDYVNAHMDAGFLKGIRRVLHTDETPKGACLGADFVRGVRALGARGLSFDLCMRAGELADADKLAAECPETTLVLDHCGNGDAKAFMKNPPSAPAHDAAEWQRSIERLSKRSNVFCKISGVVESLPGGWAVENLAPIVNHCLDAFGPDRVVFGGNWPVCLIGGTLAQWVRALSEIVASRPEADRAKLWSENAKRIYRLTKGL